MHPVESYFSLLAGARGAGSPETSGYPALANLINVVGQRLKPRVTAIIHPKGSGGGLPDGGFFTPDQLRNDPTQEQLFSQPPARGVLEVKPPSDPLDSLAKSPQVQGYLSHYGQILLTNYRAFALLSLEHGNVVAGETFVLAETEATFWRLAAQPRKAADELGDRLLDYLERVLRHGAPLAEPKDVAAYLASYAREALARVSASPSSVLSPVRAALEQSLGIEFREDEGEHFFRSTLVQTLFYGIFSAWVLAREARGRGQTFRWRDTAEHLGLPILRKLYYELADPAQLRSLNLTEILDWTGATLGRVDEAAFFARFRYTEAVQYFYEPFLAAFDPELRKAFGVWYTPSEIVRYQVARVDRILREQLDVPEGLASERVVVLDPCCGTGAYLVEVLQHIHAELEKDVGETQAAMQTAKAARERVFGFELLPAPYVVSHLQIGLLLQRWGAPLDAATGERAAVYLTNALTGWDPPVGPQAELPYPEFKAERDAANRVKRAAPILVILGNPPYDGFAGIAPSSGGKDEERMLSEAYREVHAHGLPEPQGQGLNDLYVRFFRMAERRVTTALQLPTGEVRPPQGIVCFISNYSWLDGLSYPGMRARYLDLFDEIAIDCLNGDKYRSGKRTPAGEPDPSVFSTPMNREGIQVGTAIATLVRRVRHEEQGFATAGHESGPSRSVPPRHVLFRDFWGKEKREQLLASIAAPALHPYSALTPVLEYGLPFRPTEAATNYLEWPLLTELFPVAFPGVKTSRDEALVALDRDALAGRMDAFFDASVPDNEIAAMSPALMRWTARYDAPALRRLLLAREWSGVIVRFTYRPFDVRWLYWEPDTKPLDERREDFVAQVFPGNLFLEARQRQPKDRFDRGYVCSTLADNFGSGLSMFFPLFLHGSSPVAERVDGAQSDLFVAGEPEAARGVQANLTPDALRRLARLRASPEDLFYHLVAILHSPAYRLENAGALRQDWPRVPLRDEPGTLAAGAMLGREVAELLDTERHVQGVTTGRVRPELAGLGELATTERGATADRTLAKRWGYAGQGGVTMPGPGHAPVAATPAAWGARWSGAHDVDLNPTTKWKNVPAEVWDYTLDGYQVLKKWLSYREAALLGRPLHLEETMEFTHIVRRVAALLLLQPALDDHYAASRGGAG